MTYFHQLPEESQRTMRELIAQGCGWEDCWYRIKRPDIDQHSFRIMYRRILARKERELERRRA